MVGAPDGSDSVEGTGDAGIPAGAELMAFAAAAFDGGESLALDRARERLLLVVGLDGLEEAAATIAVFNGLVRVADGTGIQLDPNLTTASAQTREELGLNRFAGSSNTDPASTDPADTDPAKVGFSSIHELFGQQ